MFRPMVLVVILMGAAGCRHALPPSSRAVILGDPESREPCIERVLRRIRSAGIVEHTADRVAGFVRVPFDRWRFIQVWCAQDNSTATVEIGGWPYPEPLQNRERRQFEGFAARLVNF